jgi:transcriptional regulator of acetoin/glycerol metabolism
MEDLTPDVLFLRGQAQRLSRLIDALESSPLMKAALKPPKPVVIASADPKLGASSGITPLVEIERSAILNAVALTGDNPLAAKLLGIGKTTLYRKLSQYKEAR